MMENADAVYDVVPFARIAGQVFLSQRPVDPPGCGQIFLCGYDSRAQVESIEPKRRPTKHVEHKTPVSATQLEDPAPPNIVGGQRLEPVGYLVPGINGACRQVVPGRGKCFRGTLVRVHRNGGQAFAKRTFRKPPATNGAGEMRSEHRLQIDGASARVLRA